MIHDTIAAISTPIGEGGIGIVRLSGSTALEITDRLFCPVRGRPLREAPSHTLHYGTLCWDGRTVDEVLVSVMLAPHTYTRETVVEINCHGGVMAARTVLDAVLASGARLAERGEFTKRAFLNRRISLDQAKAVLEVVRAQTVLGLEAAVDRLGGRFTQALAELRAMLLDAMAMLEVQIDYPDLDVDMGGLVPRLERCASRVREMVQQSADGRLIREGLSVAIVGRPNVGKSTLLNALLSEERAIVTPIPGTTRDTIEEQASLEGIPVRWIDTAGLRHTDDPVESEGVRRAREAMGRADLCLLMVDASEPKGPEDEDMLGLAMEGPSILILNKCDLASAWDEPSNGSWGACIRLSAKTGLGLDVLRQAILDGVTSGRVPTRNAVLLLDAWERDLLRRVQEGILRAVDIACRHGQADHLAEELRQAYTTASELQGVDVSEAIVEAVFSRFCVGK